MFIYAWTSYERVNWIGMAIGVTVCALWIFYDGAITDSQGQLFTWAVLIMYLAVFTYLADW